MSITNNRQHGLTLIELIMFIVIVSAALAGVLTVLNITTRSSADPMIRKQALAIAEAVLEEVMLQPFTWCDPDDSQAATATSNAVDAIGCTSAGTVENIGQETGETRAATPFFDNVNDYNGCGPGVAACNLASPIPNISGTFTSPVGYSATIAVTPEAINGVGDVTAASAALLIRVTVSHSSGENIVLEGYRTRHSPNLLP